MSVREIAVTAKLSETKLQANKVQTLVLRS